jgi:hypothetical protein
VTKVNRAEIWTTASYPVIVLISWIIIKSLYFIIISLFSMRDKGKNAWQEYPGLYISASAANQNKKWLNFGCCNKRPSRLTYFFNLVVEFSTHHVRKCLYLHLLRTSILYWYVSMTLAVRSLSACVGLTIKGGGGNATPSVHSAHGVSYCE